MEATDRTRATAAARDIGLAVDAVAVLFDSNALTLRLRPADVVARILPVSSVEVAASEVALATAVAAVGAPVAALADATPHVRDGFVVTYWEHLAAVGEPTPAGVAAALVELHAGLRAVDLPIDPFTVTRVDAALSIVTDPARSPELAPADRSLLESTLTSVTQAVLDRGGPEQPLHGEPHPGNVIATAGGLRFIDLETCCRGPVELDLAHAPASVAAAYPGLDADLLADCRALVLALVAAWRWDVADRFPDGRRWGHALLAALRSGPPWPSVDEVVA